MDHLQICVSGSTFAIIYIYEMLAVCIVFAALLILKPHRFIFILKWKYYVYQSICVFLTFTEAEGRWAFRLENNQASFKNPRQECWNWYSHDYSPWLQFWNSPCPCTWEQGLSDPRFVSGSTIHQFGFHEPNVPGGSLHIQCLWDIDIWLNKQSKDMTVQLLK